MMNDLTRLKALKEQGFFCSQILVLRGLEAQGQDNPELVRAMQGLAGGIGFTGGVCGVLTGAACLLGLYAGKGRAQDEADPRLIFMLEELVRWFRQEFGQRFGGIDCDQILAGASPSMTGRCAQMTVETLQKSRQLLVENGFDLSGGFDD